MIAAHINKNNIEQSVQEHCRETAAYAASEAQSTGLFNTMFLTGLLHDIGKNTELFNTYIHNAQQGKNPEKKINHSSAGAKYIIEKISTENTYELFTKQLIAYAIISHHGLNDCLSYDGEDKSHDHHFKWWFDIGPIRAIILAHLKGGHRKHITGNL